MNDRLAGTWTKIQGTAQLPDEFSLTPTDPVSGIYRAGSRTLGYSLEEGCGGILLIDGNQNLYQTWWIEFTQEGILVTGPWSKTATFSKVTRPLARRSVAVTATFKTSVFFPGEQAHDFVAGGSQGLHLPVFYKDVLIDPRDPRSDIRDYAVELAASSQCSESGACKHDWVVQKKPPGSAPQMDVLGPHHAELRSLRVGGLYKIGFRVSQARPWTEVNVYLPMAGSEITDRIGRDIKRTNEFVSWAMVKYDNRPRAITDRALDWFWSNGNGDYRGRPDNPVHPTSCAPYNDVLTDPSRCGSKDRLLRRCVLGGGVVVTWFGVPTRVSTASDFLIGYAIGAFNYRDLALLMAQMFSVRNDRSGTLAFVAGALHARGQLTWRDVEAMVVDIYDDVDDPDGKHRKLWPNPALPTNHVTRPIDYDRYFVSPGFLTMERK